jgi:hypothetical protein
MLSPEKKKMHQTPDSEGHDPVKVMILKDEEEEIYDPNDINFA